MTEEKNNKAFEIFTVDVNCNTYLGNNVGKQQGEYLKITDSN